MASDAIIQFTFAGLPGGDSYCFTTPQRLALDIVANMTGYIPGEYSVIIDSSTEPAVADRNKLWHKRDAGSPTGRLYAYYTGAWVSEHPIPPSDPNYRIWFEGSEADAWSFDGGDGSDPSTTPPAGYTGAMWIVDHEYDFRFPLGAGTSATPTTVSVGDTGGQETVTLDLTEIPAHSHSLNDEGDNRFALYNESDGDDNPWGSGNADSFEGEFTFSTQDTGGDADGETVPHTNMPPYRVGYWLKRSGRKYYLA